MTLSPRPVCAALAGHVSSRGSFVAIREPERDWTYGDLGQRSGEIGATLAAAGVRPGSCVALMLPNSGAFVASFFAIAGTGAIIAPFNVRYREQELVYYLDDTRSAAIVVSEDLVEVVREAVATLDDPPSIVEVAADGSSRCLQRGSGSAHTEVEASDSAILHQYTSGSTGAPKRIVRTHAQLGYELEQLAASFELRPDDRFLGAAPFSHVNGLVRSMMASMFVGGTLFPMSGFRRRPMLDLIARERITYFGGVPYMYASLAETPIRGNVDLSSLRVAFSSSAPLLVDDNRRFAEKYGLFVRQLYGSTETGTISVNLHSDPESKAATVGTPLGGVRFETRDDNNETVAVGEEGEVAISSPWAIRAYDGNPEANRESFRDGFYLSGDLGRIDKDGYLTLTGRKKFLINRAGYKINPLEVEQAIRSHPKVKEVVVLGAPSRYGDEVVRCVLVASETCTEDEIVEHCRHRIADFKVPSRIEFRDELPKSATGKVLRSKL